MERFSVLWRSAGREQARMHLEWQLAIHKEVERDAQRPNVGSAALVAGPSADLGRCAYMAPATW